MSTCLKYESSTLKKKQVSHNFRRVWFEVPDAIQWLESSFDLDAAPPADTAVQRWSLFGSCMRPTAVEEEETEVVWLWGRSFSSALGGLETTHACNNFSADSLITSSRGKPGHLSMWYLEISRKHPESQVAKLGCFGGSTRHFLPRTWGVCLPILQSDRLKPCQPSLQIYIVTILIYFDRIKDQWVKMNQRISQQKHHLLAGFW